MAKKAAAKPEKQEEVKLRIVMDVPQDVAVQYVNQIEVGRLQHDFFILCGRLPVKPSPTVLAAAKESGELHIEASLQVLIPAGLISGLIDALSAQKALYERDQQQRAAKAKQPLNS